MATKTTGGEAPGPNLRGAIEDARELVKDKKSGKLRPRRGPGGRPKKSEPEEPEPQEIQPPTEAEILDAALLGSTVWGIAGPMVGFHELNPEQGQKLGRAIAPVLKKYGPALSGWWSELNLCIVVIGLARETRIPKPVAEVIDDISFQANDAEAVGDGG